LFPHGETRDEQSVLNFVVESSELKLERAANQAGLPSPFSLGDSRIIFLQKISASFREVRLTNSFSSKYASRLQLFISFLIKGKGGKKRAAVSYITSTTSSISRKDQNC